MPFNNPDLGGILVAVFIEHKTGFPEMTKKRNIIFSILALATILRLWGVWHGYPYSYYPDEAHFVKRALSFGSFDFNPHWFHKPAFYMYLLFFEYGGYFVIGKIVGLWASVSDFAVSYIINPGPFYIIGRLTTVVSSLGSIFITYRIGEKHFPRNTGLFSALFLTLSYGHIAASQDIKADIPAMFLTTLSLLFMLDYLDNKKQISILLAALAAGIGTATKTYPIVMLMPILVAIILTVSDQYSNKWDSFKVITWTEIITMLAFLLSFFICAPYNFIDPLGRKQTFGFFSRLYKVGQNIFSPQAQIAFDDAVMRKCSVIDGVVHYIGEIVSPHGMGILIGTIAFLGLAVLLRKPNSKKIIFLIYPALFAGISILLFPGYPEPRHQLPLYGFLALTAGFFVSTILSKRYISHKIVYLTIAIGLCCNLYGIVERAMVISRQDTRSIAKEWIESNIRPGTKLLVNENGPPLMASPGNLEKDLQKAQKADQQGQFTAHYDEYLKYQLIAVSQKVTYDITEIRFPWWRGKEIKQGVYQLNSDYDNDCGNPLKPVGVFPYQYYLENDFKYAIVHSEKYQSFLNENSQKALNFPAFGAFYRTLFEKAKLVKEFSPSDGNRPGPTVKIMQFR